MPLPSTPCHYYVASVFRVLAGAEPLAVVNVPNLTSILHDNGPANDVFYRLPQNGYSLVSSCV